jgi:hypothetical protein
MSLRSVHSLATLAIAALAVACGPQLNASPRAAVPGVDPVSGALESVEVDLPGAELSQVRGPAGVVLVGASIEAGRSVGGVSPECSLRRISSLTNVAQASTPRCASLLGAYATLERARAFLLSAGAESFSPAPILAELRSVDAAASDQVQLAGLRYLPSADAFTLSSGPAGARVPAALNPGAVTREFSRRQLRALAEQHPDEAEGIALFLGAAASGDPGYLASSEAHGDPRGELDLSRPLSAEASATSIVAGALWAWSDASGDAVGAARAALAAARALSASRDGRDREAGPTALLSLVAEQLDGADRDQACAVFRARAGRLPACP